MKRIFTTLAILSTAGLATAFGYGLAIGDAKALDSGVDLHFGLAMIALILAALVHAIVLTYFMGTGRWMEETTKAYHLDDRWRGESNALKYRTVPAMVVCLGATAAQSLFGKAFRITAQRGRLLDVGNVGRALATWHPSAVLRAPEKAQRHEMRRQLIADLATAAAAMAR